MKRISMLASAGCAALLLAGCAPEEKAICEHLMKIYEGKADKPNYLNELDACVEYQASKKKRRGVNSYRREAECVLAADTVYVVRRCEQREEKKHG